MMAILAAALGFIIFVVSLLIVQVGFIFTFAILMIGLSAVIAIALGIWVTVVRAFYVQRPASADQNPFVAPLPPFAHGKTRSLHAGSSQ